MKIIYALKGRANSGKSKTIWQVYEQLLKKYPESEKEVIKEGVDIKAFITINNSLIGIESQGDPCPRPKNSLKEFSERNCDIIVCATRTSGMTVKWVNNTSGYSVEWIKQKYVKEENQLTNNHAQAEAIVTQISKKI